MVQDYLPYIIIALVTCGLIAVTIVLARLAWRRQLRRYLTGLVGRREAIAAALKSTEAAVRVLAKADTDQLVAFANEGSEERSVLAEIAARMRLEASELQNVALPKRLWPAADALGQAATALATQTGAIGDVGGAAAMDGLAGLDLGIVREALQRSDAEIHAVSEAVGLTDAAVYGGGLYI